MIELALPAGDLETALAAFTNGADGVYFGMRRFSARKSAVNFSFDDLAAIRRYSLDHDKKIYVTVNTLIPDEGIEDVYALLAKIDFYGCDGIICQDLGAASLIKRRFPSLPLHGSTQLAVHTSDGVKVMRDYGFERVVLSRELTLKEIEKIRHDCPDVELKVFIHGALCFGFSGLCMASYETCGRSGNKGECAQICRSYFNLEGTDEAKYYFSMTDLKAGPLIRELDAMGIDSAKIEGRMKSREYVASLARYYRALLDGKDESAAETEVNTNFARTFSTGYFEYRKNRPSLIDPLYPSHRGMKIGHVVSAKGNALEFESDIKLHPHDGISIFTPTKGGRELPFAFSLANYRERDGFYRVWLDKEVGNLTGLEVYKTSDSGNREKAYPGRLEKYKRPVDVTITLDKDEIKAECPLLSSSAHIIAEEARGNASFEDTLKKLFNESGESRYEAGSVTFINNSGLANPFIPLSILKPFRREFFESLNKAPLSVPALPKTENVKTASLPKRELLSGEIPWNLEGTTIDGYTYFTLPPVHFDEEKLYREIEEKTKGIENVRIGLNNIAQIVFAKAHPEHEYFIDVYLFLSNRYSAEFFKEELGSSLIGGYLYVEFDSYSEPWPFTPTISNGLHLPLFISRSCFRHDSRGLSCAGCPEKGEWYIEQRGVRHKVLVRNCLTLVF
jgi:Collagenase and related proteases